LCDTVVETLVDRSGWAGAFWLMLPL